MKVRVFLNWKERRKRNIFSTIPLRAYKNKCRRLENKPQNENLDYRKLSIGIKASYEEAKLSKGSATNNIFFAAGLCAWLE